MTRPQFDQSCPLCTGKQFNAVGSQSYGAIFSDLKTNWDASFRDDVIVRHTPVEYTQLVACLDCGLEYFIPKIAGDSLFYSQLSESPLYYSSSWKWEFEQAAHLLLPHQALLDIGCGEGHFLRSVENKLRRAEGIDTNPVAIERARSAGLNVTLTDIDAFAADHPEQYDIVCAFQVVEHLPEIMPVALAAMSCVKKDGILFVSVPNRERALRDGFWEPLDCPPHHISRWDSRQFFVLARLLRASLLLVDKQILDRSETSTLLRSTVGRFLPKFLSGSVGTKVAGAAARVLLAQQMYRLYEQVGLLRYLALWGHAMYAVLQKK